MKKIFITLILGIFLITFVNSLECTPSAGYSKCYYNERKADDSRSYAKIEISDITADRKVDRYYVGPTYVNIKYTGDSLYKVEGIEGGWAAVWDSIDCDYAGCDAETVYETKVVLAQPGLPYSNKLVFVAFDSDTTESSQTWTAIGYGWSNGINIDSIQCYDNTDCDSQSFCNKQSTWDTWSCQPRECENGQTKTEYGNNFLCENYQWINKGNCLTGETKQTTTSFYSCINGEFVKLGVCSNQTKCEGVEQFTCVNNNYVSKGINIGQCNVECKANVDCSWPNNLCSQNKCISEAEYQNVENNKFDFKSGLILGIIIFISFVSFILYKRFK